MSNNYFNSTGTIGFTCDVCGREVRGYTWNNGMKFCAKCYQETFGNKITTDMLLDMIKHTGWDVNGVGVLKNIDAEATIMRQEKQIADLEAKLAESEKQIQAYEEIVEQKDKEISFANRDKTCIVKQLNDPKAYVLLEDYKELKQQLAEKEKEIEDLKAQRHIYLNRSVDECNKITDLEFELQHKNQDKISFALGQLEKVKEYWLKHEDVSWYIDNQIKQLKEENVQ